MDSEQMGSVVGGLLRACVVQWPLAVCDGSMWEVEREREWRDNGRLVGGPGNWSSMMVCVCEWPSAGCAGVFMGFLCRAHLCFSAGRHRRARRNAVTSYNSAYTISTFRSFRYLPRECIILRYYLGKEWHNHVYIVWHCPSTSCEPPHRNSEL